MNAHALRPRYTGNANVVRRRTGPRTTDERRSDAPPRLHACVVKRRFPS